MIPSPQTIQVSRNGVVHEASVGWRYDRGSWIVSIESAAFDPVEAREHDAFEALGRIRGQLEPLGWRIGVAGAQADVWPSGMARDQGGGQAAYRITPRGGESIVDTFAPVDPATVVTVAEQEAEIDRLNPNVRLGPHG